MTTNGPNNNRPLKPTLASNRTPRAPLTPKVAGIATSSTTSAASKRPAAIRSEPATARSPPIIKNDDEAAMKNILSTGNVTPRSSARKSRVDSAGTTPSADDTPSGTKPRTINGTPTERSLNGGAVSSSNAYQGRAQKNRPRSLVSDSGKRAPSPLARSPGFIDLSRPSLDDIIDSRFFHASDARKSDVAPKPNLQPQKEPAFFYANGEKETSPSLSPNAVSPVLSAVSEKRPGGAWPRADGTSNPSRSPPMLSPALTGLSASAASPFFPSVPNLSRARSPSPSKENIHLSYRKGVSQIFGLRPERSPVPAATPETAATPESRRGSLGSIAVRRTHAKSPSLSSIDSGNSRESRQRTTIVADMPSIPSPLSQHMKPVTIPRPVKQNTLSSIDTSIDLRDLKSPPESALSPTRSIGELAADARRERKVLDLEISNSSLLAINSSLEREVRRQKAELKRFRRLSRAGRFSFPFTERSARLSEGLSAVGEDGEDDQEVMDMFGRPSGLSEFLDDDDSEDESLTSSAAEPLSPTAREARDKDRLEKDEKRLQVDLERHKELLVQSQMMNQSLKRCQYNTDHMLSDGCKALAYQVRVSDVKLGGRILSPYGDDEDQPEPESMRPKGDTLHDSAPVVEGMNGFLEVWTGQGDICARQSLESDGRTDRDSGIEVDKIAQIPLFERPRIEDGGVGRPPDDRKRIEQGLERELKAVEGARLLERPKLHWLHSIS